MAGRICGRAERDGWRRGGQLRQGRARWLDGVECGDETAPTGQGSGQIATTERSTGAGGGEMKGWSTGAGKSVMLGLNR